MERPGTVELTGTVTEAVEDGGAVLVVPGGSYRLPRRFTEYQGRRVKVTGVVRTGVETTTQQGPPLRVDTIEDLGPE